MTREKSEFSERIKRLAKAAGSQRAFARIVGVSPGSVTLWLGSTIPYPSTMQDIAAKTGVSREWLEKGVGDGDEEVEGFKQRVAERNESVGARGLLKKAREKAGLSYPQLGKRIGRDASYLQNLEEGTAPISERTIELLVAALPDLSKEDLMSGSDAPVIISEDGIDATYGAKPQIRLPPGMTGRHIPILSMAQAGGFDAGHDDGYYDYQTVYAIDVNDRKAFAIMVSGNSMAPKICEGDVVVCSPSLEPSEGVAAVIRTKSDQAMIKFWHRVGDTVILESANEDYMPITLPIQEIAGAWPIIQRIEKKQIIKQSEPGG